MAPTLPPRPERLSDFEKICYEIRACDVLLIDGRTRVSEVIKIITQSAWSHAALYIGRINDIENPLLRDQINKHYSGSPNEQLIIESLLGQGTIISPLVKYRSDHIRICRPHGLSRRDGQQVIAYAMGKLGMSYDIRQIVDLFRFLLPWHILPRRWRSTLFSYNQGVSTKQSCSALIAEAFGSVHFPILPIIKETQDKGMTLYQLNPRLYTPSDFDFSPFFDIIKYPIIELTERGVYRDLPWAKNYEIIPSPRDIIESTEKPAPPSQPPPDFLD